jgi:hypothetical protein
LEEKIAEAGDRFLSKPGIACAVEASKPISSSMAFTVLTDDQIRGLLESLTVDELGDFQDGLKSALHEYSTGTQTPEESPVHQPERISIHSRATGATTLFMPSASPVGHGVKGKYQQKKQNRKEGGETRQES